MIKTWGFLAMPALMLMLCAAGAFFPPLWLIPLLWIGRNSNY
jgi:hypothetical protein